MIKILFKNTIFRSLKSHAAYKIMSNIILGKINHILEMLWGTIRMDLETDDLQMAAYLHWE
jgi:hypothetical protein